MCIINLIFCEFCGDHIHIPVITSLISNIQFPCHISYDIFCKNQLCQMERWVNSGIWLDELIGTPCGAPGCADSFLGPNPSCKIIPWAYLCCPDCFETNSSVLKHSDDFRTYQMFKHRIDACDVIPDRPIIQRRFFCYTKDFTNPYFAMAPSNVIATAIYTRRVFRVVPSSPNTQC